MKATPVWQWNEFQQVGVDYANEAEVERYEKRMGELRDLAAEDAAILQQLDLHPASRILEIGTGSGHFARAAAHAGHQVTAIDISEAMLRYAESRAKSEGLTGMQFGHAGFLTFDVQPASFDAVVSVAVLHHLPDVWKAVALRKVYNALKPGGVFLLGDVVFSWKGEDHASCFEGFIGACPEAVRQGAIGHASKEYSTLEWIMTGLLERAGFKILKATPGKASFVQYLCKRAG